MFACGDKITKNKYARQQCSYKSPADCLAVVSQAEVAEVNRETTKQQLQKIFSILVPHSNTVLY